MKKEKLYTMGEIFRLGLLKNHRGESYKHKASLQKVIMSLNHERVQTPWGRGYALSESEIKKHNNSFSG